MQKFWFNGTLKVNENHLIFLNFVYFICRLFHFKDILKIWFRFDIILRTLWRMKNSFMVWFHFLWRFRLGKRCRKEFRIVHKPFVQSCHLLHSQFPSLGLSQFRKLLRFLASIWCSHHLPSCYPMSFLRSSSLHVLGQSHILQPITWK